ncbi:MAG: glycogen/starch synthase [Kiritimatiellae bacterium]|nr:glycogen/starch synthase [Kiritimatiellia bacterium]MDD3544521.1 glycogen/starch synthase [Kiritimatiellia bacterium]MDD4024645.1 glycogen/starch synthase [Kiritimatiellia bacterium]MDD4622241.1 glycogen/starch synthase [Kiritimatiellia bacterium]
MASKRKAKSPNKPRILIVTPEITYLPSGMGNMACRLTAKAGGLADVSASLVAALFDLGADVHVALPHYRRMFHVDVGQLISDELRVYKSRLPDSRIHLAEDRCFYYRDTVYSDSQNENPKLALAFSREIINNIIPTVRPDLIHCNDWMTGLIPGAARRMGIPCLFTVHNIHTHHLTLANIEDAGIDAAEFWGNLYYKRVPHNYEESRGSNMIDMQTSGVFASHFINTVSPKFLEEIVNGWHDFIPEALRQEIRNKQRAGCAAGILNAPDLSDNPETDPNLDVRYGPEDHREAKRANKVAFQRKLGLEENPDAPLFFWPSRLDPAQKGPQLLADILFRFMSRHRRRHVQLAVVANGVFQKHFHDILKIHELYGCLAVCDFNQALSQQGYAASDFTLVPSLFEPCGLPQMVGQLYGSLPVVHDTGGLHDTVEHLDLPKDRGNGFVFRVYDSRGLDWAMDKAMEFYRQPAPEKERTVARIMRDGRARFNHETCAKNYIDIYEKMLKRPLVRSFE